MTLAVRLTIVLLLLIAAAHTARLALGVPVTVGGVSIPMWASGVGAVVCAALAVALGRERRR